MERHGAVFNETDRLSITLQAHHDIEASLAHLPQILLRRLGLHFHHTAGQAQIAHQRHQVRKLAQQGRLVVAGKFHQQNGLRNRVRMADQRIFHGGAKDRIGQRQLDHDAVHQLHRAGSQLDDMLGGIHRGVEAGEIYYAQNFILRQRHQL